MNRTIAFLVVISILLLALAMTHTYETQYDFDQKYDKELLRRLFKLLETRDSFGPRDDSLDNYYGRR